MSRYADRVPAVTCSSGRDPMKAIKRFHVLVLDCVSVNVDIFGRKVSPTRTPRSVPNSRPPLQSWILDYSPYVGRIGRGDRYEDPAEVALCPSNLAIRI